MSSLCLRSTHRNRLKKPNIIGKQNDQTNHVDERTPVGEAKHDEGNHELHLCDNITASGQGLAQIVRTLAAVIFFSLNPINPARLPATEKPRAPHGTLVIYVATNDGLIIAADSSASLSPTLHCDDTDKIVPLRKHARAVVVVGGHDMITTAEGEPFVLPKFSPRKEPFAVNCYRQDSRSRLDRADCPATQPM